MRVARVAHVDVDDATKADPSSELSRVSAQPPSVSRFQLASLDSKFDGATFVTSFSGLRLSNDGYRCRVITILHTNVTRYEHLARAWWQHGRDRHQREDGRARAPVELEYMLEEVLARKQNRSAAGTARR